MSSVLACERRTQHRAEYLHSPSLVTVTQSDPKTFIFSACPASFENTS